MVYNCTANGRYQNYHIQNYLMTQLMPSPILFPPPLVSVIIRTQNRPTLLYDALNCLRQQSYSNIEVIIVNDAGEPCEAVIHLFQDDLLIKLYNLDEAIGRSQAGTHGLQHVTGQFINFLDDDDILYPNHIEKLVTFLQTTGTKVAYSDCQVGRYQIGDDEKIQLVGDKTLYRQQNFDQQQLMFANYLPIMSVMFRTELLETVGYLDDRFDVFEDWDFWIRLSSVTDFRRVAGISCEYRFFANYSYDIAHWRQEIYNKHLANWTIDQFQMIAWQYMNQVEADRRKLQNTVQQLQSKIQQLTENNQQQASRIHHLRGSKEAQEVQIENLRGELKKQQNGVEADNLAYQNIHQQLEKQTMLIQDLKSQTETRGCLPPVLQSFASSIFRTHSTKTSENSE